MKLITIIALVSMVSRLVAADKPAAPSDPLAGAFFPPEVILLSRDQLGLTPQQRETFRVRVEKTQASATEITQRLGRETAALSALATPAKVDEAALVAQLDRVLDTERELKHLHIGLLAWIKNSLTPEQQTKLRELTKEGSGSLIEATRSRLTAKVERVQQAAQKLAASGRDPSPIGQMMEQKVKPLLEAGKPLEAEAELDRILEQLKETEK
jgi:Spy/CpxP family protein refolding chaperone